MTLDLANLPADPALLRQVVKDLFENLKEKESLIEKLSAQLSFFRRYQFGSKSERLDPDQLLFTFLGELKAAEAARQAETADEAEASSKDGEKKGHGLKELPKNLPRDREEHPLPEEDRHCGGCGGELHRIRDEITEQLEYKPGSFYVKQHVRGVFACKRCQENVVTAPLPQQPIEKGMAGPGLLAHVLVSKYADHLPLNRLEGIFERSGIELSRSTLCDWVGDSAALLRPIPQALLAEVLKGRKVHTDETTMPVLDRKAIGTRKASFWIYSGDEDHPYTVYQYAPSQSNAAPKATLAGYEGYLQADCHKKYDEIYRGGKVVEAACAAHARRKFFEAKGTDPPRAITALGYFRLLYEVERDARGLPCDERKALRDVRSRPVLEAMKTWLDGESRAVLPKSPIGQAIAYARSNWEALTRYLEAGFLAIDNNEAERGLRPVVIGRKNYLFVGADAGGYRAAIIYSLIATAKRHKVEPWAYLRDVLSRVSTHPARALPELFPGNWKPKA